MRGSNLHKSLCTCDVWSGLHHCASKTLLHPWCLIPVFSVFILRHLPLFAKHHLRHLRQHAPRHRRGHRWLESGPSWAQLSWRDSLAIWPTPSLSQMLFWKSPQPSWLKAWNTPFFCGSLFRFKRVVVTTWSFSLWATWSLGTWCLVWFVDEGLGGAPSVSRSASTSQQWSAGWG